MRKEDIEVTEQRILNELLFEDQTVAEAMLGRVIASIAHAIAHSATGGANRIAMDRCSKGVLSRVSSYASDELQRRLNPKEGGE